jgi:hypothetical protein
MDEQPLVRVVNGTPTAEEVAALVGALLCRRRPAEAVVTPPSRWALGARPDAGLPRPGGDAWRASALPR